RRRRPRDGGGRARDRRERRPAALLRAGGPGAPGTAEPVLVLPLRRALGPRARPGSLPAHVVVGTGRGEVQGRGPDEPLHREAGARRAALAPADPETLARPARADLGAPHGPACRSRAHLVALLMPQGVSWGTPARSLRYLD